MTKPGTSKEFIGVTQLLFYKTVAAVTHYSIAAKSARSESRLGRHTTSTFRKFKKKKKKIKGLKVV